MGKYVDGSGLSHFMGIIKGYFAAKTEAISNITRSGTTFTATRADGTSFTFTQQDNTVAKTTTTPKMAGTAAVGSETKYAAGDHVHPTDTTRVPTTRTVNGHALSADVTVTASDIGVADGAEVNQNAFSNVKVGTTTVAADSKTDTLELAAGTNITLTPDATNDKVTIATSAEVNQNAFANVKVGTTTVAADAKQDTLELAAGANVTLTPDAANDKVTIAATDTTYSEATTSSPGLLAWLGPTADGSYLASVEVDHGTVNLDGYTLSASDIPNLPASKITSGTFSADRIPSLAISKVTNLQTSLDAKAPLASPALTGTPTAPTAAAGTNTTQVATTAFVTNAVGTATAGALQYKGTATNESTISGQAYKKGWYYIVATAGTYFGKVCEVGDMLIAKQNKTSTPANDWDAIQSNIEVLSNSEIDALWAAA